jgi:hypothetical protein
MSNFSVTPNENIVTQDNSAIPNSTWQPGELAPHLFYISGKLTGMAAAIPRIFGGPQEWEAYDMRCEPERNFPVPLGMYASVELAKRRVEEFFRG